MSSPSYLDTQYPQTEKTMSSDDLYLQAKKYFLKVRTALKQYDNRGYDESRTAVLENGDNRYTIVYKPNSIQITKEYNQLLVAELIVNLTQIHSVNEEKILKKYHPQGYISYRSPNRKDILRVDVGTEREYLMVDTPEALRSAKSLIKEICLLIPGISSDSDE